MDDFSPSTGPLSNNQATNDNTPTLSGTADANSTVTIYDNGTIIDSVLADGNGNWTWTSSSPLSDELHAFTATATNQSGTGGMSPAFNINIDTQPPLPPDDLNVSADGTVVTGTTEPGNTVVITSSSGTQIGSGVAGPDGSFTITINPPQTNGESIEAIATDPAGNPSLPETALAPDITAPQPPTNLLVNGTGDQSPARPNPTVRSIFWIRMAISLEQQLPIQMGISPQRWFRHKPTASPLRQMRPTPQATRATTPLSTHRTPPHLMRRQASQLQEMVERLAVTPKPEVPSPSKTATGLLLAWVRLTAAAISPSRSPRRKSTMKQ